MLGVVGQQCCVRLHAVLHQRVGQQKNMSSSTDKHHKDKHSTVPKDLDKQFSVLKEGNKKFDCLVYEMLLIRELKSSLSVQSDSIWANVLRDFAYFLYADHYPKRFLSISLSAITFELENGVKMTLKRRSVLSALFFTCFCITKPLFIN